LAETAKERLQKFNDQSTFLIVEAAYATEGARLGIAGKSVWAILDWLSRSVLERKSK
jgi:hypothetical protein